MKRWSATQQASPRKKWRRLESPEQCLLEGDAAAGSPSRGAAEPEPTAAAPPAARVQLARPKAPAPEQLAPPAQTATAAASPPTPKALAPHPTAAPVAKAPSDTGPASSTEKITKASLVEQLKEKTQEMMSADAGVQEMDVVFERFYRSTLICDLRKLRPESKEVPLDGGTDVGEPADEKAADTEERLMFESLQANSFKFSTEKKKGNAIAGRWGRVMKGANQWSEEYARAAGYPAKRDVREKWAKWLFTEWEKSRRFEKVTEHTKRQKLKGT
eukprot:6006156-Pyramimonas_sp.AAC.1